MSSDQGLLFGKTSQEFSQRTIMLSAASWPDLLGLMKPSIRQQDGKVRVWFLDPSEQQRGASWMPNISAWPNDAHVCSLSSVLETAPIPQKYYLSSKACAGILRRAAKRGKELPPQLKAALEEVAQTILPQAEDSSDLQMLPLCLNGKGRAGRIDAESETFVLNGMSEYNGAKPSLRAKGGDCAGGSEVLITHALRADGFDASEDGTGRSTPLVAETLRSHPRPGSNTIGAVIAFRASGQEGFTPAEITPPLCNTDGGGTVPTIGFYANDSGGDAGIEIAPTLRSMELGGQNCPAIAFSSKDHGADAAEDLAPTLRSMGHDASHANGGGQLAIAMPLRAGRQYSDMGDGQANIVPVAFQESQTGCREYGSAGTLRSNGPGHDPVGTRIREGMAVRRLTPLECERLQGFPDGYTAVEHNRKPAADGPRYKALGNSMAVPVLAWIGRRICEIFPKS